MEKRVPLFSASTVCATIGERWEFRLSQRFTRWSSPHVASFTAQKPDSLLLMHFSLSILVHSNAWKRLVGCRLCQCCCVVVDEGKVQPPRQKHQDRPSGTSTGRIGPSQATPVCWRGLTSIFHQLDTTIACCCGISICITLNLIPAEPRLDPFRATTR